MKAVVLEVRGREAALLMEDGTVRRARGKYQPGQELEFLERRRLSLRQWLAAVAVAVLLLAGSVGMWIKGNWVACAGVSLDVNPSVVYTLNRRGRVLSVRAVNADAKGVASALTEAGVRLKPVAEAVEMALDAFGTADCVLAGVVADDEARREALAAEVEAALAARGDKQALAYRVLRMDRAAARAAQENGMSPGRYVAWQQSGGETSAEAFADLPVSRIIGAQ